MPTPYEREIEELLKSLGDIGPKETGWLRFKRRWTARKNALLRSLADLPRTVPADQLMLTAILFVVAGYFMRLVLPSVARFVFLAGLILFVAAFFFSFNQLFGAKRNQRRWRGQPIDMRRPQPTILDHFIFWLRRKMRGY
jgi:hypothetical protein